jgi:translation initiation factor 3 subunit J
MPDWEASDSDTSTPAKPSPAAAPKAAINVRKGKWDGEDEEDDGPVSDWEQSSEEEEEQPKPAAPIKKKGTIKAKIAEKEAAMTARKAAGEETDDDDEYDSDAVLDPRERARMDKERELNADLDNAASLLGAAALGGTSSSELDALISANPRTKDDFQLLSTKIIDFLIKRHQSKPLYASFVEHHVRALAEPLKDVEVRKAASGLTTLANEKQKEQREKASGKKKVKAAAKPGLGAAKLSGKLDTNVYDEALDDFGTNADDFM